MMQVCKFEDPAGTRVRVEFTRTDGTVAQFKSEIWAWIQVEYPSWSLGDFFTKLSFFTDNTCIVDTT